MRCPCCLPDPQHLGAAPPASRKSRKAADQGVRCSQFVRLCYNLAPTVSSGQLALSFAEVTEDRAVYEYAVLVTALDLEVLSVAQLYRDRAENGFDETQWGWGGFTTQDLQRCRVMARCVVYNWWSLFGRLPDRRLEAITTRPLLLHGVPRRHAARPPLITASAHGSARKAQAALTRIAAFFAQLRSTAEQWTTEQRWYRILSQALVRYLNGSPLRPPPRLVPT